MYTGSFCINQHFVLFLDLTRGTSFIQLPAFTLPASAGGHWGRLTSPPPFFGIAALKISLQPLARGDKVMELKMLFWLMREMIVSG